MMKTLWITICLGTVLLTLLGCKKSLTSSPTGAVRSSTNSSANAPQKLVTIEEKSKYSIPVVTDADGKPQGPKMVNWWNSITPAEREAFLKLPPTERANKINEIRSAK